MWLKRIAEWSESSTVYLSIPFTWNLPQAYSACIWHRKLGYNVKAGGPAVDLMPNYLNDIAEVGGKIPALFRHNPLATFTSRGCIRSCKFCAVPRIEGHFIELEQWEPKPIICDNNLLACSKIHFEKVIDSLKTVKGIDFNQGLDCRLLTDYHLERITELNLSCVRFAWDAIKTENQFMDSINKTIMAGIPKNKIRAYVLIGFRDTPEDALYRLETVRKLGIRSNPQRYQAIDKTKYGDPLVKNSYCEPQWTKRLLSKYMRYWARQNWLSKIPFDEYIG
jgi:hypothetical protein